MSGLWGCSAAQTRELLSNLLGAARATESCDKCREGHHLEHAEVVGAASQRTYTSK